MVHKHQTFIVELLSIGSFYRMGSYELTGEIMSLCPLKSLKIYFRFVLFSEKRSHSMIETAVGMISSK